MHGGSRSLPRSKVTSSPHSTSASNTTCMHTSTQFYHLFSWSVLSPAIDLFISIVHAATWLQDASHPFKFTSLHLEAKNNWSGCNFNTSAKEPRFSNVSWFCVGNWKHLRCVHSIVRLINCVDSQGLRHCCVRSRCEHCCCASQVVKREAGSSIWCKTLCATPIDAATARGMCLSEHVFHFPGLLVFFMGNSPKCDAVFLLFLFLGNFTRIS